MRTYLADTESDRRTYIQEDCERFLWCVPGNIGGIRLVGEMEEAIGDASIDNRRISSGKFLRKNLSSVSWKENISEGHRAP